MEPSYPRTVNRPSTPQGTSQNYDINEILKKYNHNREERNSNESEINTLKNLCKSKSGYLYSQAPTSNKYANLT